jgi:hypothetical protein
MAKPLAATLYFLTALATLNVGLADFNSMDTIGLLTGGSWLRFPSSISEYQRFFSLQASPRLGQATD